MSSDSLIRCSGGQQREKKQGGDNEERQESKAIVTFPNRLIYNRRVVPDNKEN